MKPPPSRQAARDAHFRAGFKVNRNDHRFPDGTEIAAAPKPTRRYAWKPRKWPHRDPHLTLAIMCWRYQCSVRELGRRCRTGELPMPIDDGRVGVHMRWSRRTCDVFDRWRQTSARPRVVPSAPNRSGERRVLKITNHVIRRKSSDKL